MEIIQGGKKGGAFKKVWDRINSTAVTIRRLISHSNGTNVKPVWSNFENPIYETTSFCRILYKGSNTQKYS